MANASGGVIALGIEDDGTVSGICGAKENAFRKVPIDFLQTQPQYRVEIMVTPEGERIMLFHISPSENDIIKRTNGDAFLRVGDSSRQLSSEEITALEYSKGIRSFETRIISEATVEDLDFNLIEEYRRLLKLRPQHIHLIYFVRGASSVDRIIILGLRSQQLCFLQKSPRSFCLLPEYGFFAMKAMRYVQELILIW